MLHIILLLTYYVVITDSSAPAPYQWRILGVRDDGGFPKIKNVCMKNKIYDNNFIIASRKNAFLSWNVFQINQAYFM